MKNPRLGSDFDEFLAENGLLEAAELVAIKRVLAFQLVEKMKRHTLAHLDIVQYLTYNRMIY